MADKGDETGAWRPIAIPLRGFEYVHSPYDENVKDSLYLFAGRDGLRRRLVSLLQSGNRKRGSYLIAGYRGVGKTSLVNRAISVYRSLSKESAPIIIKINLGDNSKLTPFDIYFSIANFLRDAPLKGANNSLEGDLDDLIERMGHEISETRNMDVDATVGMDAGAAKALLANLFGIKIGGTWKRNKNNSKRILPMSAREAEDRILKILERVRDQKVIFIFDEIDKLSNSEEFTALGQHERVSELQKLDKHAKINTLLGSLKNFITTAEATFFFISGRDTLDRYYSEKGSPNSLYESLFDSVFEVPSLLTDERIHSTRPWRMALLIEEYLCRRLMNNDPQSETPKEWFNLKKHHSKFIEQYTGEHKHEDGRLLASTLRNFTYYLTFHSWGNPKRLSSILESFIVSWSDLRNNQDQLKILDTHDLTTEDKCGYALFFDTHQVRAFSLAAELITIFEHQFSREISKISDKLTVTSLASLQFILKYHSYAFSRESLLRMSEAMSVHRSPALNAIVDDLLTQTFKSYIRRVRNGVYRYRFHSGFEQELRYISHVSEIESAAYNFSLDSMRHVKHFFEDALANADAKEQSTIWRSHIALGDICAVEQSYNEASAHYSSAIRLLKQEMKDPGNDVDLELLLYRVEAMVKNGDLEEHRQNYGHAAAIYAEASRVVENILTRNSTVASILLHGDSKWDILKQPFWAGHYLSLKRSPRETSISESPDFLFRRDDPRFCFRAANLAFFSGHGNAAIDHYLCVNKNLQSNGILTFPNERDAYLRGNAMVGLVEASLAATSNQVFKSYWDSYQNKASRASDSIHTSSPKNFDHVQTIIVFIKRQFSDDGGADVNKDAYKSSPSDVNVVALLSGAARIFEENRIYISAALTLIKLISYLSAILDAFDISNKNALGDVPEKIYAQALKSGKDAVRCINKARQVETSQSGKTLLVRDLDDCQFKIEGNLNIPLIFDFLLGGKRDPTSFSLEEQIFWQQSLWAHKLVAALVWAQFAYFKVTQNLEETEKLKSLATPAEFSAISVRPAIAMRWLQARDISRRQIDGCLVMKDGTKCRNPLPIFKAYSLGKGDLELAKLKLTPEGIVFAKFCAEFNQGGASQSWPAILLSAHVICENLYFALTSIRIISRRNMDLIFPRMSQIYFTQWKMLIQIATVVLLDRRNITSPSGEVLNSLRDVSFLMQRMLIKINKDRASHERIPPTHFDYEYVYLRLCESLDSAVSLVDPTSRARTGIFNNKYYCHDDYGDAEFSMDYTLAYMFSPFALRLRQYANETHEELLKAIRLCN